MFAIVKSRQFLIGVAVGFLVVPYISKNVTPLVGKLTGKPVE